MHMKTNRNDSCPCGSGKKYKKCCKTGRAGGESLEKAAVAAEAAAQSSEQHKQKTRQQETLVLLQLQHIVVSNKHTQNKHKNKKQHTVGTASAAAATQISNKQTNKTFIKTKQTRTNHKIL